MVTFYDPVEKKEITYSIAPILKISWDKLKDDKLKKKDEDRVYVVDGRERFGKSIFSLQQAKYLDPTFNLLRVCFTPKEFLHQVRNAPKGSVIVFDEAFRGLSSKASQSRVNKKIVQAMMEMGQKNLIVFIVLPTIFLLEMYAAVLRSNALFHIYKDRSGRRRFRIYNYNKKSWLYKVGRKKGFDYSFPRINRRHTGRFYGNFPIDEVSYRKKKLDSFRRFKTREELTKRQESVQNRTLLIIKKIIRDEPEINYKGIRETLKDEYEIDVTTSYIGKLVRANMEKQPETEE
ncbi:hypothetical protein LCGC14_0912190 [marine sediment metagenome]|uniref:Zona occludens toxin N-terminal domain-containing protein n=1 Tax=marine sediment metagenome TaxID=412755 RepID=A0A0F9PE10_9ZZZZ